MSIYFMFKQSLTFNVNQCPSQWLPHEQDVSWRAPRVGGAGLAGPVRDDPANAAGGGEDGRPSFVATPSFTADLPDYVFRADTRGTGYHLRHGGEGGRPSFVATPSFIADLPDYVFRADTRGTGYHLRHGLAAGKHNKKVRCSESVVTALSSDRCFVVQLLHDIAV